MKRFIFVLLLILSVSGLFAKSKRLYTKSTDISLLELYQDKDIEGAEFCLFAIDYITEDETDKCMIICDDEKKIKKFLQYLLNHNLGGLYTPTITAYEAFNKELTQFDKDLEIDSENNILINKYWFELE